MEVKVYKQKVKHLLYEQENHLAELKAENMVSEGDNMSSSKRAFDSSIFGWLQTWSQYHTQCYAEIELSDWLFQVMRLLSTNQSACFTTLTLGLSTTSHLEISRMGL